ncbi:hypothetical protein BCR32DRAFT_246019 [Anaeromyces robustus]|uniref:Uncharacterized protein n=1 Tax=Anaeromyces robustus TaxID=1754192 RepID=A0A1Y1X250_9FUNG|nr:hypothetical protein BCR32DRAFT_246019 [Anaeromyces robustus]|eukprot:ORX79880.1 hypothetical protein BCR32DRAFT_246019 [Anaeromyces robustus]
MSTVEHIDSILNVPYGKLSKKEIEYCLNVIRTKRHEVIFNTTTGLYIKMAKHALARELWSISSKCCKSIAYMINNYKVEKSMECELYLLNGYYISRTPYIENDQIKKYKKNNTIYITKVNNDSEALKNAIISFKMAIQIQNHDLIINATVFTWNIIEFWLNVSREFSYLFYYILKMFDDTITQIKYKNKKWALFIKYELTKCLIDIKKFNYNLHKIKLKNIGKDNMDVDFDVNDTSIFPENSYLKNILMNIKEDKRLMFFLLIEKSVSSISNDNINELIINNINNLATLSKLYDPEDFPDFLELYVKFILTNNKKSETKKQIKKLIQQYKIKDHEKIFISLIKCSKKLPLSEKKIDKHFKNILKYNTTIIENEEEGHTISFDSFKWSPQNYFVNLAYLALESKNYSKVRAILNEIKFSGYTDKTLVLKKKLIEIYVDMDEYLANPSLVLLSEDSINFQLSKMKKMKELITSYEKQDGDKNFIQKVIQIMWNYMFPLLQTRLYPKIKPYIEFLYRILNRINSPLFILRSVIGKELAKICEYDLEYTRALKYLRNAYLIVNDYDGLLKSNAYHLLNLKCYTQQNDVTEEERLYLKIEDIRKSHNTLSDAELENILKIHLNNFTNAKRNMEVEDILPKKYNMDNYTIRHIDEFNTYNRCKTAMMALLKIIDLAFQRKIYSIAFDGASIIIFNKWNKIFSSDDYYKISLAHVSHIRSYIILHYWKIFKNNKQLKNNNITSGNNNDENNDIRNHKDINIDINNSKNENKKYNSNNKLNDKNDKFFDYYESRNDSLPYKEKLMEDVLRAINIGLELNKKWIVNNSASIIYDFILIQSKTIINENKDCLFMGYFDEIKILYEKLKISNETSSLLYIYISAIYMQALIESIEYELYGEIKLTNEQRKLLEKTNSSSKKVELNNYFNTVKEIYNFFISSNLKLDNYISMTISSLWIRYKQSKASEEENSIKEIEKNSLFSIDNLENVKVYSIIEYEKKITKILNQYLEMDNNLTLSNWIESLVRIGRCAMKEKLYNIAYKCFNSALKQKVPTNIQSNQYKNKYDANICFYWTSVGYFEYANVYQEFININYIITNIQKMHLDSINYLVESLKYLRLQSSISYELFLEIAKRTWNISLKLLKYKTSYPALEKVLYELIFISSRITTEQKKFKEYFKDPENQVVPIFSHIFSLLLELNILNNNWTSGLHIISKLNALLPKKSADNYCYLEKLQFFFHTHNEMGLNALFMNRPELQLYYWTNIACMEENSKEQVDNAYKTCIDLCEEPTKKAEYIIKYVDWMYTHHVNYDQYYHYLEKAWDLIDPNIKIKINKIHNCKNNQIELKKENINEATNSDNNNYSNDNNNNVNDNKNNENNENENIVENNNENINENNNKNNEDYSIYIDETKQYSVYQIELLIRSFILYLTIKHTKSNTNKCISTIYTLLYNLIQNSYKTVLLLQSDYKKRKNKNYDSKNDLSKNNKNNNGNNDNSNNNENNENVSNDPKEDEEINEKSNKNKNNKNNKKGNNNKKDTKSDPLTINDYYYSITLPELPNKNSKDWIKYVWPNAAFNILEDSENKGILKKDNLESPLSLIGAIFYIIEECFTLFKYNYIYFFQWINEVLINHFIESDKNLIKSLNYALGFHIYHKMNEKGIAYNKYYELLNQFPVFNTNINLLTEEKSYSIDKLDILQDFPYNNNCILIKIIEFIIMNKDLIEVNKIINIISQIEERSSIRNENVMSELIYCKLYLQDHINKNEIEIYSPKQYVELCKIGLNLKCHVKTKYKIAVCYLEYLVKNNYSFEEFDKVCHITLNILLNSASPQDWYSNVLIGKFHQTIGILLSEYILKWEKNPNKIFKLAYEHFNLGLSIFDSNQLYYYKSILIIDYTKVIYSHLLYNKIWSKNLLLICLSLLKESQISLERYKMMEDSNEFIETTEYKNCVDLITILTIEIYIIINQLNEKILYGDKISIDSMISNYIMDSYIPDNINEKYQSIKRISLEEAQRKRSLLDDKSKHELVSNLQLSDSNNNNTISNEAIICMNECFKNVISMGLASLDYEYIELCSEYLYKLTNDDLSHKFGYLSLLQNCVYSNAFKELLIKTTNSFYPYSYIKSLLQKQVNSNKEYYAHNNITIGWKRFIMSKNYLTNFKNIPKGIDILIIQHSLNKKMLYTGLINREVNQGKGKEGSIFQYDFLEYKVDYEEWKKLIYDYNSLIEKYEIDSNILDYIIKKEFNERKEKLLLMNQEINQNQSGNETKKDNEKVEEKVERKEKEKENKKKSKQEKKNNKNNNNKKDEKINKKEKEEKEKENEIEENNIENSNEEIKNKINDNENQINNNENNNEKYNNNNNKNNHYNIDMEIKEKLPENIIKLFQSYIGKIVDYLTPIFEHYKKKKPVEVDKKKITNKKNESEKEDKTKYNLIICCDKTFLYLPLGLIFNLFSSWDIIYKEFSYNMLLHRYREQFSSDKEFPPQNQDFVEVNYLNCMVNFDKDVYAKKDNSELKDIQINNINELKNIFTSNNILNKWPGSYFTKIQNAQSEQFFAPPGFLYINYKRLFDEISLDKFNYNLSGVNHAILLENIAISKFKTKVYKHNIKETINTIMLLSLYGVNNIYYQPYLVDLNTNKILLDTIFKCHGVPLNEILLGLYKVSKVPLTCCECFGLPTSLKIKTEKKEN